MRGKSKYNQRQIKPDWRYNSVLVARFINKIMLDGKKQTATAAAYRALEDLEKKVKKPALESFEQAIKNVSPQVEVRSKRIGGATYQVPMAVRPDRKIALAMRWIIEAARSAKGKSMGEKLAIELAQAFRNEGNAIKKRDSVHRMAEANKAFAHYARF